MARKTTRRPVPESRKDRVALVMFSITGFVLALRHRLVDTPHPLLLSLTYVMGLAACICLSFVALINLARKLPNHSFCAVVMCIMILAQLITEPGLFFKLLIIFGVLRLVATLYYQIYIWLHCPRWPRAPKPNKNSTDQGRKSSALVLPCAHLVAQDSKEFKDIRKEFRSMCKEHASWYDFNLSLVRLYKVTNSQQQMKFSGRTLESGAKGNVKKLIHGTDCYAVPQILVYGFKLPSYPGMFGKGIYFADCPLKSWQYCCDGGLMLNCDVDLGNTRVTKQIATHVSGKRDLAPGWIDWVFGVEQADSITAATLADGGSVRVPEYVIYSPDQTVPQYVFEIAENCECTVCQAARRRGIDEAAPCQTRASKEKGPVDVAMKTSRARQLAKKAWVDALKVALLETAIGVGVMIFPHFLALVRFPGIHQ